MRHGCQGVFVREPNPSQPLLLLPDCSFPCLLTHVQSFPLRGSSLRMVRRGRGRQPEGEAFRSQGRFVLLGASPGRLSQATTDGGLRPVLAITRCSFSPISNRRRYHRRPGSSPDGGKPSANTIILRASPRAAASPLRACRCPPKPLLLLCALYTDTCSQATP